MTKRELVEYMDNRVRNCWRLLDKIPEEKWDWRPAENMMTLGEIANHVATMLDIETGIFEGKLTQEGYTKRLQAMEKNNKQDLIAASRECHTRAMKFYLAMTEEDFETETFTTPAGTTMTYKGGVLAELEHYTHHRSQLYLYLGLLGVELDPCDIWS